MAGETLRIIGLHRYSKTTSLSSGKGESSTTTWTGTLSVNFLTGQEPVLHGDIHSGGTSCVHTCVDSANAIIYRINSR